MNCGWIALPSSLHMVSFVGGGHIFVSMHTSGLSLQTIDVKSSLPVDCISLHFSQLVRGIKYFDIIFVLGLTVLQQLIFLSFRLSNKSDDEKKNYLYVVYVYVTLFNTVQHTEIHTGTADGLQRPQNLSDKQYGNETCMGWVHCTSILKRSNQLFG